MSDKATPAFIQQLIARMGKSGDAAGILTLFAHMAELEARLTAARAGKLDLIGAAADAAGTTSLFARLAQIADYVDTLETKLGLNTDAAGTTTLFARLAQIAGYTDQVEGFVDQVEGYTDTLETNLGTTADVANAAGTVLARLAELLTNRLTAARAGKLDNLDALISSRAGAVSVQRGLTAIGTGLSFVDVTITAVNTAKSFVSFSGFRNNRAQALIGNEDFGIAYLTSSTTLQVSRASSSTVSTITIPWEVVQFA